MRLFGARGPTVNTFIISKAERETELSSRLSVYAAADYQPVLRLFEQGQKTVFERVEIDRETGCVFLLGYYRKENRIDYFAAKLIGQSLQDVKPLDPDAHDFYRDALGLKQVGYTERSFKWSSFAMMPKVKADLERFVDHPVDMGPFSRAYTLDDLKGMHFSLAQLWEKTKG